MSRRKKSKPAKPAARSAKPAAPQPLENPIARWWFAPAPAERLAALRILIGGFALLYLWARFYELYAVARFSPSQFQPVGVTRMLEAPLSPGVALAITIATVVLLVGFVLGFRYRIVAPLAAIALLWTTTYRNSWGMVFHTENLLVLHVIALSVMPAADRWAIDKPPGNNPPAGYGWGIKLLVALTAITYVLAGIAKLRIAGLGWINGELLRNQIAIDNLRKALLGDGIAPLATPFLEHPKMFTAFCALTIAIELGAPIALVGGRPARLWALMAWGFHLAVVLLMNIWFFYPLLALAFLPILRCERPIAWLIGRVETLRARWRDRRRTGIAAP